MKNEKTLEQKIEELLLTVVVEKNGLMYIPEGYKTDAFNGYIRNDKDGDKIGETVKKMINHYNESDNKEFLLDMEIEDVIKIVNS